MSSPYRAPVPPEEMPEPDDRPVLFLERRGPRLSHGGIRSRDGDFHPLRLPHADWDYLAAALESYKP